MAVLDPVVGPAAEFLFFGIAELIHRCAAVRKPSSVMFCGNPVPPQRLLYESESRRLGVGLCGVAPEGIAFRTDRARQSAFLGRQATLTGSSLGLSRWIAATARK